MAVDITFYTWDECPEQIKGYAPYTKYFFEDGNEVTMVAVVKIVIPWTSLPFSFGNFASLFKDKPTDGVMTDNCHIWYWAKQIFDAKCRNPKCNHALKGHDDITRWDTTPTGPCRELGCNCKAPWR